MACKGSAPASRPTELLRSLSAVTFPSGFSGMQRNRCVSFRPRLPALLATGAVPDSLAFCSNIGCGRGDAGIEQVSDNTPDSRVFCNAPSILLPRYSQGTGRAEE